MEEIRSRAVKWMIRRGWKHKLAKRLGYEQSLFEHSLVELDVLLELLPILADPRHYNLNQTERKILAVAVLVHDVGKETDLWQRYLQDLHPKRKMSHILPDLTSAVIPDLCNVLGFESLDEPVQRIMAHCAQFHHSKPGQSDGTVFEAILGGGSDRFLTLAQLIKALDQCCSAASASEAKAAMESDTALGNHLRLALHEVLVRGVSTTLLHRAAQDSFQEAGWRPILYFYNATLYAADPNKNPNKPALEAIRARLKLCIEEAFTRDITSLMVGSPTGNILPKPDLLDFRETRQYLESAARKISPRSFDKKPPKRKREVVEEYWRFKRKIGTPTEHEVELDAARISVAQPEMLIFKFFKATVDPDKVRTLGKQGSALARKLYEEAFGTDSWSALQSTSTLMPAKDMGATIDYFWRLPGKEVSHSEVQRVEELPDIVRMEVLIDLLDGIVQKVYSSIGRVSPRDQISESMAEAFIADLLRPTVGGDIRMFAQEQMTHYNQSKPFAGKESTKGVYLCPICNSPFDPKRAVKASADFVDSPQSHTNRGVAHGSFGYVEVCTTCYYERLLLQILLGSRPAEMITLVPRLNLGYAKGEELARKVREWIERAKGQMRGETGNLEWGFSLGFTDWAARHLGNRDPFTLEPGDLLALFSYRFSPDTQKKRRKEALKRLHEEFDESLDALNLVCSAAFPNWDAAVDALMEDQVDQQEFKAIRREAFRLNETIHLICQTPNVVFIPVAYEVAAGSDESETNKALRRLYVALILSLVFDASVAISKEGEWVDFRGGVGAAYVSPVPAVRSLVGQGWLTIACAKRWIAAIGAASLLVRDTGLPNRSALYQILVADPPERLARRIEQGGGKTLTLRHLRLIEQLPDFLRTEEKEEYHESPPNGPDQPF